jgi:Rrf2 family iron-sulfur cluster assembly transcriptional regulator
MATHEEVKMSAAFLHEKLLIPYPYLRQILASLSRKGFIHSIRGRSGGFAFSKATEEIFLADIIEATDGLESLNNCILGFSSCPMGSKCSMHSLWENTRKNIRKVLEETSLANLGIKNS